MGTLEQESFLTIEALTEEESPLIHQVVLPIAIQNIQSIDQMTWREKAQWAYLLGTISSSAMSYSQSVLSRFFEYLFKCAQVIFC